MIILAFDSTAKAASLAVTEDEKLLALYNIDNGLTQSELLLPMAENMLKSLKLTFDDIGLLACAVGPGSFTACEGHRLWQKHPLRIGIHTRRACRKSFGA